MSAFDDGGEPYDVYLLARPEDRGDASSRARFTVPTYRLASVPLEEVTTLRPGTGPLEINRLNRRRQVTIVANILPGAYSLFADAQLALARGRGGSAGSSGEPERVV